MKLAVFGLSTSVISSVVHHALAMGFGVALLRADHAIDQVHKNLVLIEGGIKNSDAMHTLMRSSDAVICILHPTAKSLSGESRLMLDTIIAHMHTTGTKRLVLQTSAHDAAADILRYSGIDWTIVDSARTDLGTAKHIVSQVTDARYLSQIFIAPSALTQQAA